MKGETTALVWQYLGIFNKKKVAKNSNIKTAVKYYLKYWKNVQTFSANLWEARSHFVLEFWYLFIHKLCLCLKSQHKQQQLATHVALWKQSYTQSLLQKCVFCTLVFQT